MRFIRLDTVALLAQHRGTRGGRQMTTTAPLQDVMEREVQVGRDLGEEQIEISAELVRWYIEAVETEHPWYTGASPFGGPIAPALVLHNAPYRRPLNWYLPNLYGNLHAKMAWELFRPIPVGSTVLRHGTVVDRYLKRDREFMVAEAEIEDEHGRLYCRTRSTQSFLANPSVTGTVVERGRETESGRQFRVEEPAGDVLAEIEGKRHLVTPQQCDRFSNDRRNYHNDVEEAAKLGFREVVVQGTLSICFLSDMLTERYGEGWFLGGRLSVNLVNVLWAGEAVRARGAVRGRTREGSVQREQLDVWTEKDDGTRTIAGSASAIVA
jgi:acyl dehydratase